MSQNYITTLRKLALEHRNQPQIFYIYPFEMDLFDRNLTPQQLDAYLKSVIVIIIPATLGDYGGLMDSVETWQKTKMKYLSP